MDKCNKHGGKREGAGRKASGKVGKSYYLTLSQEATERLNAQGSEKSKYIDSLILADISESETPQLGQRVQVNVPGKGWLDGEYIGCSIDTGEGKPITTHKVYMDRGWSMTFRDEVEMRIVK